MAAGRPRRGSGICVTPLRAPTAVARRRDRRNPPADALFPVMSFVHPAPHLCPTPHLPVRSLWTRPWSTSKCHLVSIPVYCGHVHMCALTDNFVTLHPHVLACLSCPLSICCLSTGSHFRPYPHFLACSPCPQIHVYIPVHVQVVCIRSPSSISCFYLMRIHVFSQAFEPTLQLTCDFILNSL